MLSIKGRCKSYRLNVINDLVKIENKNGIVFVRLDEIKFDKSNHAGKKNGKQRKSLIIY